MKILSVVVVRFILTVRVGMGTVGAQVVANTCAFCPNQGVTAGDDYAPYAEYGDPITCGEITKNARLFEAGTYWCGIYKAQESLCCPMVAPLIPCGVCPDGITVDDDVAISFDCTNVFDFLSIFESESDVCNIVGKSFEAACCPAPAEDPCIICPDGASSGDDLVPFSDRGDPRTCEEIIYARRTFDAGSEMCHGGIEVANCCPAPDPPGDPCTICPGGATSGDDFVPFTTPSSCGEMMASARLLEAASEDCEFFEGFEISCCPGEANDASTMATMATMAGITITSATAAPTIDCEDCAIDVATASVEGTVSSTNATSSQESIDASSVSMVPSRFFDLAFISVVSVLWVVGFL
jgi:hypothetical protein